jgi:hypothetical protein
MWTELYGAAFPAIGIAYAVVCMLTAAMILWRRALQPVALSPLFFLLAREYISALALDLINAFVSICGLLSSDSRAPAVGARRAGGRHVGLCRARVPESVV